MGMDAATMQRLSALLDRALEVDPAARAAWLDGLAGDDASLTPLLRKLLESTATSVTSQFLARPPPELAIDDHETAPAALAPGDLVGAYRLERLLGRGGMGEVWLAARDDGTVKRKVALKLPHVSWSPTFAERFARERDILATLEHPHIARLYDAGVDRNGRPFMALEYVEGKPIDAYCRDGALTIDARLRLLLQVADAVAFAHSRLVLHRDLKPGNVLVTDEGNAQLLDFGIAKMMEGDAARETALTRLSGRALTPNYASPEQIRGEPIGTASDVYSLGVVAFELLTEARPYNVKHGSATQVAEAITAEDAPLASTVATDDASRRRLRGDLDAILNKALKKRPAERYATVDGFAADLRRSLEGERVEARPDTLQYRAARLARRYRVPLLAAAATIVALSVAIGVGAAVLIALALAAGLGVAVWQLAIAKRQRDRALRLVERQDAILGFMNTLIIDAARGGEAFTAEQLLKRCEALLGPELEGDPEVHGSALSMMAMTMQTLGNSAEAIRLSERAVALLDASTDIDVRDRILVNHAMAIGWAGRDQEARATMERVLQRDDLPANQRAEAHHYLAFLANSMNDGNAAVKHAEAALAALRSQRNPSGKFEASMLANLGMAYSAQGRMGDADTHLSTAYRRLQELGLAGSPQGVTLLNNWAVLNERAGDVRRAQELTEQALALGGPGGRSAFLLLNLARTLEHQGRLAEAEARYEEGAQVARDANAPAALIFAKAGLASVLLQRGEPEAAGRVLAEGDELASTLPDNNPQRVLLQLVRGRLALHSGEYAAARASFEDVIAKAGEQAPGVMARLWLSETALNTGDVAAALSSADAAKATAIRLQGGKSASFRTGLAAVARAKALAAAGRLPEARTEAAEAEEMLVATVDATHPALAQARADPGSLMGGHKHMS
jgi:serine/threonine-protein kinase